MQTDQIEKKFKNVSLVEEGVNFGTKSKISRNNELSEFKEKYDFWETQPVPTVNEKPQSYDSKTSLDMDKFVESIGVGDKQVDFSKIRLDPYPLPPGFKWDNLDLTNESEMNELYTLLNQNYVEDGDCMFRFNYSPQFLGWALKPPGWRKEWHLGIRVANTGKLICFIGAIPATLYVRGNILRCVEINFLCVHKKLRSKRIAPMLITEITRRVNLQKIWYAVYTAGAVLPKPCATTRYWHRSINVKKLVEIKFSHLTPRLTLNRAEKLYHIPTTVINTPGLRAFKPCYVKALTKLLSTYLARFELHPIFDETEVLHYFTMRKDIVATFVVLSIHKEKQLNDIENINGNLSPTVQHLTTEKKSKNNSDFKQSGDNNNALVKTQISSNIECVVNELTHICPLHDKSHFDSLAPELKRQFYKNLANEFKCPNLINNDNNSIFCPYETLLDHSKLTVTDLISFYSLPSTVIGNAKHDSLRAAYSFYNIASTVKLQTLMQDALALAKYLGYDVFNALDVMDNGQFLQQLKFGIGDGHLQYYIFNFRCPQMVPSQVGLVLQ